MQEIWKDIYFEENGIVYDYRGLYQVSNFGRVKSLHCYHSNEEIILSTEKVKSGYLRVYLSKNNKSKKFLLHRLVAIHFISNPENKLQVNHEDGNKENCHVSNLTWVTNSENQIHAFKIGLKKSKESKEHYKAKKVIQYDLQGNFIKEWDCIIEVEKQLNIHNTNIIKCCKGKRNKAGNYIWKYKDVI